LHYGHPTFVALKPKNTGQTAPHQKFVVVKQRTMFLYELLFLVVTYLAPTKDSEVHYRLIRSAARFILLQNSSTVVFKIVVCNVLTMKYCDGLNELIVLTKCQKIC